MNKKTLLLYAAITSLIIWALAYISINNIYYIIILTMFLLVCWPMTLAAVFSVAILIALVVSIARTMLEYRKFKRERENI